MKNWLVRAMTFSAIIGKARLILMLVCIARAEAFRRIQPEIDQRPDHRRNDDRKRMRVDPLPCAFPIIEELLIER